MGPRHGGRETFEWQEGLTVPGQTGRRKIEKGNHENSLLFVGRVSGHICFYKERERAVGGNRASL